MHNLFFITIRLVSQVIITDAKLTDATRINDLYEDVFEGRLQDIPFHRNFLSKERHSDVNTSDLSNICQIGIDASTKMLKATNQNNAPIGYHFHLKTIQIQPHVLVTTHQRDDIYSHNGSEV